MKVLHSRRRAADAAGTCSPRRLLTWTLCLAMTIPAPLGAWQTTAPAPSQRLTVLVLQGQGAVNFIPDHNGATPVVEVRDQNSLPVEGADVVFTLPATGPGGTFSSGGQMASVRTNADGQASANFVVNSQAGPFQIRVAATSGERTGSAVISQSNSLRPAEPASARRRPLYRSWKLWAVVAGAAAAGAALALTRGSVATAGPTVTITPGSGTVGHP